MSIGNPGDKLSKNQKREAAREQARQLREQQRRKDRRSKWILQGSIILASLAIVAIIAVVLVNSVRPAGPGPRNMASDGIQLTQGGIATQTSAIPSGGTPVPNERDEAAGVLDIQMYVDYLCPICGEFEATNGDYIASLLENGDTTLEIHPISILDRYSAGTKYPTRAANAAACVADMSPNQFLDFHNLLFENQPEENTAGLSDEEIIDLTVEAGVENASDIAACISDQQFKSWVTNSTDRATTGPIPNSNIDNVLGTPTILVNGQKYEGAVDDLLSFQAFVVQAAGSTFNETSTPSPSPSATL